MATPTPLDKLSPQHRAVYEAHYSSLIEFTKTRMPEYITEPVHDEIAHELQEFAKAVERQESPRLILTMPPRHGKSYLASESFPAWYLGRNPHHSIIATSYNTELAARFSRRVRELLRERWYQQLFPARLSPDSTRVDDWELTDGGGYRAAGIGSGVTGRGAHVLLIDDPVKDAEQARSERYREAAWEWFNSTAYTRLMPGGGVILIMTRWNLDDLAGRILDRADEGRWRIVNYPAINEAGEALCPNIYDTDYLSEVKQQVGNYVWSALYQQNPIADESMPFKEHDFVFESRDRSGWELRLFGDVAYTAKAGDKTAFGVCGIDSTGARHLFESFRGQVESNDSISYLFSMVRRWGGNDLSVALEAHPAYHSAVRERMRLDNFYFPYKELKHDGKRKIDRILTRRAYLHAWTYDPATKADVMTHCNWSPDLDGTVEDDFPDMMAYADMELSLPTAMTSGFEFTPEPDSFQAIVMESMREREDSF